MSARRYGPWVSSALRDLGVTLDDRGLMPLAEARKRLRATTHFARGESHIIPGQPAQPTDADFLWAALLSLEDAAEFVHEAGRLRWRHSPRGGADNVAPVERYGAGVLPWLSGVVGPRGEATATLAWVQGCLLALDAPEALELLSRLKPPPGQTVEGLRRAWSKRHGLGGPPAPALPPKELEAEILATLDAAAALEESELLTWPRLHASVGHLEAHHLRLIGARRGEAWGVFFEVVQGDVVAPGARWPAVVQQYRYGTGFEPGGRYLVDARALRLKVTTRGAVKPFEVPRPLDVRVSAPGVGRFVLDDALARRLDLRPGRSCSGRVESWPAVLAIRAALALDRGAFWTRPETVAGSLGMKSARVIVASDAFEHVEGAGGANARLRRLPSASPVFRSLARALATGDGRRFAPGRSNLDWRGRAKQR